MLLKKTLVLFLIVLIASLAAGLYGILHDQFTYSISPEYYTKFKFIQFGFITSDENIAQLSNIRLLVALVGAMATWWVGTFIGFILGLVGFIHPDHKQMLRVTLQAFVLALCVALLGGLIGLVYGKFYLAETGVNWWLPENLIDKENFIAVGSMHNCSYLCGLLGLMAGIFYSIRQKRLLKINKSSQQTNTVLKETFLNLLKQYTNKTELENQLWEELETSYSGKNRHYHNLGHLENLLNQLLPMKGTFHDWETILFSLYYHDAVYNAAKSDNEEKSAELAVKRMLQISVPLDIIERCKEQILATKSHTPSIQSDTNYFTDADLSILGQDWETYLAYCKNVRKEYSIYPNLLYNPGRKKVLHHFLSMERIFKTDLFYNQFEKIAKENMRKELDLL